jgi:hypothetical protein
MTRRHLHMNYANTNTGFVKQGELFVIRILYRQRTPNDCKASLQTQASVFHKLLTKKSKLWACSSWEKSFNKRWSHQEATRHNADVTQHFGSVTTTNNYDTDTPFLSAIYEHCLFHPVNELSSQATSAYLLYIILYVHSTKANHEWKYMYIREKYTLKLLHRFRVPPNYRIQKVKYVWGYVFLPYSWRRIELDEHNMKVYMLNDTKLQSREQPGNL